MLTQEPEILVKEFDNVEDYDENEDETESSFRPSITSYGADYDVLGLIGRLRKGVIEIPDFQRSYVWDLKRASSFIESLLLELPVPSIFLYVEPETKNMLVVDGQQRLKTLQYFYDGKHPKATGVFELKGVQEKFDGLSYEKLSSADRNTLDNSLLHATVMRQNKSSDERSIYEIFKRLNTGGVQLLPQEIRASVDHGDFNNMLKELNENNEQWRKIYGGISPRAKDQELILRFFALYFDRDEKYKRPMKSFLDIYMSQNKGFKNQSKDTYKKTFERTIETVYNSLGVKAFKPVRALNAAVFDSVMVGLARRLERGEIKDYNGVVKQYEKLLNNPDFDKVIRSSTSNEEIVRKRLELAIEAFASVK